jgi:Iron-sulfur cluster assembly protein
MNRLRQVLRTSVYPASARPGATILARWRQFSSGSSPFSPIDTAGQLGEKEREIRKILKTVIDPTTEKDIVTIGSVQGIGLTKGSGPGTIANVTVDLDLFVPGYPFTSKVIAMMS